MESDHIALENMHFGVVMQSKEHKMNKDEQNRVREVNTMSTAT